MKETNMGDNDWDELEFLVDLVLSSIYGRGCLGFQSMVAEHGIGLDRFAATAVAGLVCMTLLAIETQEHLADDQGVRPANGKNPTCAEEWLHMHDYIVDIMAGIYVIDRRRYLRQSIAEDRDLEELAASIVVQEVRDWVEMRETRAVQRKGDAHEAAMTEGEHVETACEITTNGI
jgi:hypothetical protein